MGLFSCCRALLYVVELFVRIIGALLIRCRSLFICIWARLASCGALLSCCTALLTHCGALFIYIWAHLIRCGPHSCSSHTFLSLSYRRVCSCNPYICLFFSFFLCFQWFLLSLPKLFHTLSLTHTLSLSLLFPLSFSLILFLTLSLSFSLALKETHMKFKPKHTSTPRTLPIYIYTMHTHGIHLYI